MSPILAIHFSLLVESDLAGYLDFDEHQKLRITKPLILVDASVS